MTGEPAMDDWQSRLLAAGEGIDARRLLDQRPSPDRRWADRLQQRRIEHGAHR